LHTAPRRVIHSNSATRHWHPAGRLRSRRGEATTTVGGIRHGREVYSRRIWPLVSRLAST
jgi:hypothetical protein